MPTRIPELPASTVTSSNDLLPISQYTGAKRETRKITSAQLRDFININPNLRYHLWEMTKFLFLVMR